MKLQNFFPYNSSITRLDSIYHSIGDSSHFINSPCIVGEKIIYTGKTYVLLNNDANNTIKVNTIRLMDAFYHNECIYLLVRNIESEKVMLLNQFIDINEYYCHWKLLDMDYLKNKAESKL